MNKEQVQLFSSFFSAIQSFVQEMIRNLSDTTSKRLESMEMGNFLVSLTAVRNIKADIVMITDKSDHRILKKFLPKLIKILSTHSEMFLNWDGDMDRFKVLDLEIIQLLQNEPKLLGTKSITEGRKDILKSIITQLPELEEEQKAEYLKEREFLSNQLNLATSLPRKLKILQNMEDLSQKLKDLEDLERIQNLKRKVILELRDTKNKITFFIRNAKAAVTAAVEKSGRKNFKDLEFRDVYLNLYSFGTKLKLLGQEELSESYKSMAKLLIEKPAERLEEIPQIVTAVLNLQENAEFYIRSHTS